MEQITYRKLSTLKKLSSNPRTIKPKQLEILKEGIARNPEHFKGRPILLSDRTGELVIIAGNMRYEACLQLGIQEVPTLILKGLTEDKEKEIIIRDNISNGDWDWELLANQWDDVPLDEWGLDTGTGEASENPYTDVVDAPIYEITGEQPAVSDLFDDAKTKELIERIDRADIKADIKTFLKVAAGRHTVFRYDLIAEYYAHSDPETQKLFEDSALVIIDFNQAIESGYIQLTEKLKEIYAREKPAEN